VIIYIYEFIYSLLITHNSFYDLLTKKTIVPIHPGLMVNNLFCGSFNKESGSFLKVVSNEIAKKRNLFFRRVGKFSEKS